MSYRGPATFQTAIVTAAVDVHLETDDSENLVTWGGIARGTEVDLMQAVDGTLTLPNGHESEMHVAARQLDLATGGVLLRLDGAGPAPY